MMIKFRHLISRWAQRLLDFVNNKEK